MNRFTSIAASVICLATALAAGLWFLRKGNTPSAEKPKPSKPSIALLPGESLREDWPAEEVFRRAFWRHPTSDDRIVRAVRFESSGADGVSRWAWFMKIHPSAELLRNLRDTSTFGLLSTDRPKPSLPGDISAPIWYSGPNTDSGVEVLQHPSQGLTVRYHSGDNLLYASDYGKGFGKALSN